MKFIQDIRTRIFITVIGVSVNFSVAYCQPSYSVGFNFKFFNANGESIDYDTFCKDYQLLGMGHRNDQTPCTNDYMRKENFYNDSTTEFYGGGTIVYNDLIREFVHKKDTMLLILSTNGGGNQSFRVDSLIFKPGKYYIKQKNLPHVDFEMAEAQYYNFVLRGAMASKKTFADYENSPAWIELNSLKRKYGISPNDFAKKTASQIIK